MEPASRLAGAKPLRLFFAMPIAGAVRQAARACIDALGRGGADAKWAEPETLHLTLRFLGPTAPDRVPALEQVLAEAVAGRAAFDVEFDELGYFADRGLPKVVWAGVGTGAAELQSLESALSDALERLGVPREERPFKAHLTLGRLRSPRGAPALRRQLDIAGPLGWRCRVDRLILYKSLLSPKGARHEAISERRLG